MSSARENGKSRRRVLRGALGVLGSAGLVSAVGAAPAGATARASGGATEPELPHVPGMRGDRRANEFWYQFDEATFFQQTPELKKAYADISAHVGGNPSSGVRDAWLDLSGKPGYPDSFAAHLRPVKDALQVLSAAQSGVFRRYYGHRPHGLFDTMSYFAQGVLFDPRRAPVESEVHTMDGKPPLNYHTWHAFQYANVLLGIERRFWTTMIPLNGFAWGLQLIAEPDTRTVNPPQQPRTVARVAASWLPAGPEGVDARLLAFHRS